VKPFSQGLRPVRVSVKAVIIAGGSVLLVRNTDDRGDWYLLPGGGQDHGETLEDALRRECREEIGAGVVMGRLLFIRDYIAARHEFAEEDGDAHQLELMFRCRLSPGEKPQLGNTPDPYQRGVEWLPLKSLGDYRLYPSPLRVLLAKPLPRQTVYLGDVN
jgi:ADP-ribose pyrophosphatase YjhB (NUDIX family)